MQKITGLAIGDNKINLISKEEVNEKIGDLTTLKTTAKDNIVNAINEVNGKQGGGTTYTAGTGIDITGDSISINQANLDKINAVDNKADKINITEGQPYDTGERINGKKIMKVVWLNLAGQGTNIQAMWQQLEGAGTLLEVRAIGNNWIDDDGTKCMIMNPVFPNQAANEEGGIIIFQMSTFGTPMTDYMTWSQLGTGTYANRIKGIEITYLE